MSQGDGNKKVVQDKELDELLNSALADFDKLKTDDVAPPNELSPNKGTSATIEEIKPEELWNDEFIAEQAKLFEEKMTAIFGGPNGQQPSQEEIQQGFQKIAEAAAMALQPDTENVADPQFTQSISEALRGLNAGQENLQSPFNPDDISRMFSGIDLSQDGGSAGNQFLPFMQGMMQSLLSAEVLLPSLKDLSGKYPQWLAENGDKIEPQEKERFIKQQQLMELVCSELETELPTDSAEVKKERFHKVLENMQKMQDLGTPPQDLVGDLGPTNAPPFDPSALNDPSQCSLM